jgi:cohesin loading factor subunit SCC2
LDLTRVQIARELAQASDSLATPASDIDSAQTEQLDTIKERISAFSRSIWEANEAEDVFGPTPEDAQPRVDAVSLALSRSQPLATMYQPLITRVIEASESSQVALRTKALRGIGLIVAQDPNLFHQVCHFSLSPIDTID